jgi:hypothetical protein
VQTTTATLTVQIDPEPAPALRITTTSLPTATVFEPYDATLAVSGGTGSNTWSITSGALPTGLSFSAGGEISGTPTETGTAEFTAQVQDSAGTTTSASLALLVVIPTTESSNWSGYVVTGGPFDAVQGTFTVPSLTTATQTGEDTSIWVGIDGADNEDLIQAGVQLEPQARRTFAVVPWWEILPADETPITDVTINVGDSVTVAIGQQAGTASWQISLTDNTNGQSFTTDQTYAGPADSAEWIVEAPTVNGVQTSMAPYSPVITFSNLLIAESESGISEWVLIDPYTGLQTSTPSALDTTGFNVAYGPTAPPPP